MVNQPTFNPNDREQLSAAAYRNRAATDIIEPGSSIKPFVVAAALQSGRYDAGSIVDTSPGFVRVGSKVIEDKHPQGAIDLSASPRALLERRHDEDRAVARSRRKSGRRCRSSASGR